VRDGSMYKAAQPLVWLLMGTRTGDNNQLRALARALGFPFEAKAISFNQMRRLPFPRIGLQSVAEQSRALIAPPWPDLVICVGYASVPVARHIRRESGGRTKLVHIGNPRAKIADFDLQITTPQYTRGVLQNLLELRFPIGNPAREARPSEDELRWLEKFPCPRRLVAVGGPARHWQLDHRALEQSIRDIRSKSPKGSLIVATSPRTSCSTRSLLDRVVDGAHEAVIDSSPAFGTLLKESDEIYVTADSVSMLSEAILSGKPVGIIPIARSLRGRISHLLWEKPLKRATLPNFANFWDHLRQDRLIGTVELPVASQVCDTVECAADAVRSLMAPGSPVDERKAKRTDPHLGVARRPSRRQRPGARARKGAGNALRDQGAEI